MMRLIAASAFADTACLAAGLQVVDIATVESPFSVSSMTFVE